MGMFASHLLHSGYYSFSLVIRLEDTYRLFPNASISVSANTLRVSYPVRIHWQ